MSNTATAAMMLPIAIVILEEIIRHDKEKELLDSTKKGQTSSIVEEVVVRPSAKKQSVVVDADHAGKAGLKTKLKRFKITTTKDLKMEDGSDESIDQTDPQNPHAPKAAAEDVPRAIPDFGNLSPSIQGICKTMLLSIAYGANIGGTGTLIGTGPTLVFVNKLNGKYWTQEDVTFLSWLAFGMPMMVICVLLGWLWLMIMFLGWKTSFRNCCRWKATKEDGGGADLKKAFRMKLRELGSMSFAEYSIIFWLVAWVLLLILRQPIIFPGWDEWLQLNDKYSSDACAGMLIAMILFVSPNEKPDFCWFKSHRRKKPRLRRSLVTWENMQSKFPWGILLLLGGGFALVKGIEESGLNDKISDYLKCEVGRMNQFSALLIIVVIVAFVTEFASNVATASIFVPIAFNLASRLNINPLYMGLPTAVGASFAFMLPVATPPNAIVYSSGMLKMKDMLMAGLIMNVICISVALVNVHTWSKALFKLDQVPTWVNKSVAFNETMACT